MKEVEIDVPTTGRKYHFPCQCWFGKDKEDGKTARILSVTDDQIQSYKPSKFYFRCSQLLRKSAKFYSFELFERNELKCTMLAYKRKLSDSKMF